MAKYEEPFLETQQLYDVAIKNAGLKDNVVITVLVNNKSKEIFKVNKANDLLRHRAGDDVIIVLNEKIFEKLEPDQRVMIVDESLAPISYDTEKDAIVISKPDVVTFSGVIRKHTFEALEVLRESIKTFYEMEKQAEDEAKALVAKAKGKKKYV